jgi:hypothetical protein
MGLQLDQTAYVCGGPKRVVLVTVLSMCGEGKLTISQDGDRVMPGWGDAANDFEAAVLETVPASGMPLDPIFDAVVRSEAMRELCASLVEQGLVRRWRFAGLTSLGRQLRRQLAEAPVGLRAIAVHGCSRPWLSVVRETAPTIRGVRASYGR